MEPPLTKSKGRVKFNGHYESWYSFKTVGGYGVRAPGRHVDNRGIFLDKDGYILVATSLVKMGETIETSLGMGKRYDTTYYTDLVDIYTSW